MRSVSTILFTVLLVVGCRRDLGEYVRAEVNSPSFIAVESDISADIFLEQAGFNRIMIEGYEEDIEHYRFSVKRGILRIEKRGFFGHGRVRIYLALPDLAKVENHGSGRIIGENYFSINGDISVANFGSGKIDLDLDGDDLDVFLGGSGKIYLRGQVDDQIIHVDGSGNYYGFQMFCEDAEVYIEGSGDVELFTEKTLYVRIDGSGNVYYRGYPYLEYEIFGSGRIYDSN